MDFEVKVKPSAKLDLFKAIGYYDKINSSLAKKFYTEFLGLQSLLKTKPHFALKYKNIRTCKLKSFPYLIHLVIDNENKIVTIVAIVFGKQGRTDFGNRTFEI